MNLKQKYEYLRIIEDEGVENYIHRVTNLVDGIGVVSGHLEECDVVHKILLNLPKSYKSTRCAKQDSNDLSKYNIDQLKYFRTFKILEMEEEKREKREATFNVSRYDDLECS